MENVVSLETAKKLKAAGFPQDTYMIWWNRPNHKPAHLLEPAWYVKQSVGSLGKYYAAPGAQDIANQLPKHLMEPNSAYPEGWGISPYKNDYNAYYGNEDGILNTQDVWDTEDSIDLDVVAPSMAEALAQLWLKVQHASPAQT